MTSSQVLRDLENVSIFLGQQFEQGELFLQNLKMWDRRGKCCTWVRYLQERPGQAKTPHDLRAGCGTPCIHRLCCTLYAGSHHHVVASQEHLFNVVRQECIQCAWPPWCATNSMFNLLNEFCKRNEDLCDVAWIRIAHQQLFSLPWLPSMTVILATKQAQCTVVEQMVPSLNNPINQALQA